MLRSWIELGRITFMGGLIRCRNRQGSVYSLSVFWYAGSGLVVYYDSLSFRCWGWGALARKFRPLAI